MDERAPDRPDDDPNDRRNARTEDRDAGAYIGHDPELAAETIPGGIRPDDERVAATASQSSGEGSAEERVQGSDDDWPGGHAQGDKADDDARREAGKNA